MLKKIAAALIAASVLTAPMLIAGTAESAAATTKSATPAKPGVKAVHKHRKHVRHARRGQAKYVKVMRHGKLVWVKARTSRHHAKHVNKPIKPITRQGTKGQKAPAA